MDWDNLPDEVLQELKFTGIRAIKILLDRQLTPPFNYILAYTADPDMEFPEGDTDLVLLLPDELPSSFPYGKYVIADFDYVIRDFRRNEPRGFQVLLEKNREFLFLMKQYLSTEKKQELIENFTQSQYRYDKAYHLVQELI